MHREVTKLILKNIEAAHIASLGKRASPCDTSSSDELLSLERDQLRMFGNGKLEDMSIIAPKTEKSSPSLKSISN